jgi:hypothetical protein
MIIGYKLRYKCFKHNDWQEVSCDSRREVYGLLGDMRRMLTDYKIITLERITEFELLAV